MDTHNMDSEQRINEHWQRQARFCGGLENTLQYYDTVQELKRNTAHETVSEMLSKVGIPRPINATLPVFDSIFPSPRIKVNGHQDAIKQGNHDHATNAEAAELQYYTSTSLSNTVMAHYMEDYLLFGIKAPQWAVNSLEHRLPVAEREKNIQARRRR